MVALLLLVQSPVAEEEELVAVGGGGRVFLMAISTNFQLSSLLSTPAFKLTKGSTCLNLVFHSNLSAERSWSSYKQNKTHSSEMQGLRFLHWCLGPLVQAHGTVVSVDPSSFVEDFPEFVRHYLTLFSSHSCIWFFPIGFCRCLHERRDNLSGAPFFFLL